MNAPNNTLAAFYVWLRDAATDDEVTQWAQRRKTALAADRVCASGFKGRHVLDVISDPKGLLIVSDIKKLRAGNRAL